jgi:hypothetical protein
MFCDVGESEVYFSMIHDLRFPFHDSLFTSYYSLLYNDLSGSGVAPSVTLALSEMRVSKEKGMFNQSILPQQWGAAINGGGKGPGS